MAREKILIIDDQAININIIANVLSQKYQILIAINGHDGLKIMKKEQPSLVLLDIVMPDMDGYQVAQVIREDAQIAHIPFIFLTSKNDTQSIVDGFQHGAVDYVAKPFVEEELSARIDTHIQLANLQHSLEQSVAQLKENNHALAKANQKIEHYAKVMDEYVISSSTDLKGTITDVSTAYCKVTGYTKEELIGKNHRIIRHQDMSNSVFENLWSRLQQDKIWRGEIKNKTRDGGYYWADTTIVPEFDEEGKKIGYRAIRHKQQDILKSRSTDFAPEAVYWVREDASIRYVNNAVSKMLGYSQEELFSMNIKDLVTDEMRANFDHFWSLHWNEVKKKKNLVMQAKNRCKDGTLIDVELYITYHEIEGRGVMITYARDISSRIKQLKKIQFYKTIFDGIGEGVFVIDIKSAVFEDANAKACSMLGYTKEEIVGQELSFIRKSAPNQPPMDWDAHIKQVKSQGSMTSFGVHLRKDGSTFPVEANVNYLYYGDTPKMVSFVRDITQRKAYEAQQQTMLKEIEDEKLRFELAIEGARDGLYEWNMVTGELYLSKQNSDILGIDEKELGETVEFFKEIVHPDDIDNAMQVIHEYLDAKGAYPYVNTFRWRTSDGSYKWIKARGKAIFDKDGVPQKMIGFNTDITQEMEQEKELTYAANHDTLTGLPNRFYFETMMQNVLEQTRKSGRDLAVIFIDLDGFKAINDTFGHEAGDAVLVECAKRMKALGSKEHIVARLGGDEFVIALSNLADKSNVETIFEKLLDDIQQPITYQNKTLHQLSVSASVGVSFYPFKEEATSADELLRQADQAMYIAKKEGKNRFHIF